MLGDIITVVNFHRIEVDVVLFYPVPLEVELVISGLSECRDVQVTDPEGWSKLERQLVKRGYDTLVVISSGVRAVDDYIVMVTMTTRGIKKLALRTLFIPSLHQSPNVTTEHNWADQVSNFDFSVYWGSAKQYLKSREVTLDETTSCRILYTQQDPTNLTTTFLNKLFLLVQKLTQVLLGRGEAIPSSLLNMDHVRLLRPNDVFVNVSSNIYIKASYG